MSKNGIKNIRIIKIMVPTVMEILEMSGRFKIVTFRLVKVLGINKILTCS